jgi:hypothetical protein
VPLKATSEASEIFDVTASVRNPLPCFPSPLQWGGDSEHSEQGWGSDHATQTLLHTLSIRAFAKREWVSGQRPENLKKKKTCFAHFLQMSQDFLKLAEGYQRTSRS